MSWTRYLGTTQDTLDVAQSWLDLHKRDGAICPCCEQPAKIYRRKLNGTMAYALALIYLHFRVAQNTDWLHVPEYLSQKTRTATIRGGDWAKLRLWDLIIPRPGIRGDGSNRTGFYKLTPTGTAFAQCQWQVPQHVLIYNQSVLGYEGPFVTITDVVGDEFDYDELMSS